MFTDTHCHINKSYYDDISLIINEANKSGIYRIFNCGCEPADIPEVLTLAKEYSNSYPVIGFHPQCANAVNENDINQLGQWLKEGAIALGEIGLDYHWEGYDRQKQIALFEKQLQIATERNLPVVIHSRDAGEDTISILKKYACRGVIHSFTGSYEMASRYIKLGYLLGINGVITFKNTHLRETLAKIPIQNIVLETDAPYLTPEPFRGQKNDSSKLKYIAEIVAQIYDITAEELANITNENIKQIFDI